MKILLTPDQESTMRSINSCIQTSEGQTWYHSPYWYKDLGDGCYEQVTYENLPEKVKDFVLAERGLKLPK